MAPPPDGGSRRRELLDAVIECVAAGGIGNRSLRDLAVAVGTSHRMLLHHFGSREELLLAVVQEVERRQAVKLADLPPDPAAALAATWADLRQPELWPFERLFFECYARGAQGEEPYTGLLGPAIDGWLADIGVAAGAPLTPAQRAFARLALATLRGLLLDLVATGDEAGVDAAAQLFIHLVARARNSDIG